MFLNPVKLSWSVFLWVWRQCVNWTADRQVCSSQSASPLCEMWCNEEKHFISRQVNVSDILRIWDLEFPLSCQKLKTYLGSVTASGYLPIYLYFWSGNLTLLGVALNVDKRQRAIMENFLNYHGEN